MLSNELEFYINIDGDIVIDKESFKRILEAIDKLENRTQDEECVEKVLGAKKQYCCTVEFNGDFLENYEYKEYPLLAEGVCVRHTIDRCGVVNGCSGHLSRGLCNPQ